MIGSIALASLLALSSASPGLDEQLEGKLVNANGHRVTPSELPEGTRLVVFYYTASWCANCRAIEEPMLEARGRIEEKNPNVSFVWASLDRSAAEMASYYAKGSYEGLAIRPGVEPEEIPGGQHALDNGIPALRIYEAESGSLWPPTAELATTDIPSQLNLLWKYK